MANAWDEYKKKHGISVQQNTVKHEAEDAEGNAWERYKKARGISMENEDWRYRSAEETKRKQEQRQDRGALNKQKQYLDDFVGPYTIGGEDAAKANYYGNLLQYGNKYGDVLAQDNGFRGYKQAISNADKAFAAETEKNRKRDEAEDKVREMLNVLPGRSDLTKAERALSAQDRRYARDTALYNQMAQAANQAGSKELWDKAAAGYDQANADYGKAFSEYGKAYSASQQKYLDHLQENDRGTYIGMTTTAEETEKTLEDLNAKKAELEAQYNATYDAWANDSTSKSAEEHAEKEQAYLALEEQLKQVDADIEAYETAKKYHYDQAGKSLYDQYLGGGKVLAPEMFKKVDAGKERYEADKKAAAEKGKETQSYGLNIIAKARGVWRQEKDYLEEAGWDPTFDAASNLRSEDENLFYALYADDPKAAMQFAAYADKLRNEEYEGWMAEWAGESGWNAGAAFFQALGNRIGSGAANFVDPHSATTNQLARTASGLLAGGSQFLNEWSGTIDTDIPIVRDLLNGKGLGDFYQLANSIVESGINAYAAGKLGAFIPGGGAEGVGALGVMLMGSSASAADYNECIKRGLTPGQAQKHALAAGINEALFEFVSMDKLIDTEKLMMASTVGEKIKGMFVQAGVEASEEFCTTLANTLADGAQARRDGYDNSIEYRTKELIALGMDRKQAEEQASKEWLTELINDAIGGFISGGGLKLGAYAVSAPARATVNAAVNSVQNRIATNKTNELNGSSTSAEEAAALRSFAEANGIKVSERVAQSTEENETENAPTTEQETKLSRREIRQERKANRDTGALQTAVVSKLAETVHERGLNSAQEIYTEQTGQHSEGITRAVQTAVEHEARAVFGQAQNQNELNELYQKAVENVTAQPVKQAIQQAYTKATTLRAYQGDNQAMRDALTGPGSGKALNLEAEITGKDGSTQQVRIASLDAERGKVKLDNGKTVALNELQGLDADTKDVIEKLDRFDMGDTRALAFHSYLLAEKKGEVTDGVRFVMEYALAYDQGRNGVISLEEATKRSSLPADIVKEAYDQGALQTETWRKDQERQNAEKRAKAKDGATGRKGILDKSRVSQEKLDSLSADKKDALSTLELLAEATGVDIRLIAQKADKKGNVKGYQGLYNKDGNYIEIDVNAGLNNIFKDMHTGMTAVLGHELTHWMQENAPTEYLAYKKAVLHAIMSTRNGELTLERMIEAQINQNKREGKEISRSQAEDEVVADASMKRLGDSEFWDAVADNLGEKKADVFAKIKEYISQFFNRVREIIGRASHTSEAANLIDRVEAEVQANLRRLYAEGIGAAMRSSAQTENTHEVTEIVDAGGEEVGIDDGNGHEVFSERTYEEGGRDALEDYLSKQVKKNRISQEEMDQIIGSIDQIYEYSTQTDDSNYRDWSRAIVKTNIFGKPIFSWVKANSEYNKSIDASLICIKRRTLDAVFDYMIQNGMFDDFKLGQQSIVAINDIIRSKGFEIACGLCYIDAKRYRAAMVAGQFAELYNELVKSMLPKGMAIEEIGYFNYGQNSGDIYKSKGKGLSAVPDSQINFTYIDKVIRENKPDANSSGNVLYKSAMALKENPSMRKLVSVSDFMSKTGFENVTGQNAELLKLYNAKKGTGGPKATEGDVQYLHEIVKASAQSFKPESYFKVGGLRVQSFSDYIPRLVMDYAELIGDLAAKKLPAHAYSKELMFALQFGMTGMKINMSLIPNLVKGGVAPGLDANGNYAWRDGQSFGSTVYGINESQAKFLARVLGEKVNGRLTAEQGFKLAQLIQNAEGYRDNCGTIAIGVSDQHIWKMLDDPAIRMIIPYHKSGLNHILASLLNVKGFTDYTNSQNTLKWDGEQWVKLSKDDKDFNFNEYMYTHKCDARTAAQAYLDWCEQNGFKPKFGGYSAKSASYNENADFTKSANYYKVLEDFNSYDAQTEAALPQQAVKAIFPSDQSAFGSMKELMKMAIDGEALQQARQDKMVPEIVEEIQKTLPALEAKLELTEKDEDKVSALEEWRRKNGYDEANSSLSTRSDADYLAAVERGDMETAQKMVDEAAKEAGYIEIGYHGTYSRFNAFDPTKSNKRNDLGPGIYLTTDEANARGYAGTNGIWNVDLQNNVDAYAQGYADDRYDMEEDYEKWVEAYNTAWDERAKEIEENGHVLSLYAHLRNPFTVSNDAHITTDEAIRILKAMPKSAQENIQDWIQEVRRMAGNRGTITTYDFANSNWSPYLSSALSKLGYDGIKDSTVNKKYSLAKGTEHYVVFNATDVKSTDPVTYDDSGKVIPLSERFNTENEDIRYSVRPASELYQTEFDFSEPMTTDDFREKIAQENETSKYFPKSLSEEFVEAIGKKQFFTKTKLYRGIDANEFAYLTKNGFLKSNSSYNFEHQQGQTLADENAGYALSYATKYAPKEIRDKHYKEGNPSYLIEFVNSPALNMTKNEVQESYTYDNIDQKYITRIFEIEYDPTTEKDYIWDVTDSFKETLPQLGRGLAGYAHGAPEFYRDKTTGTILYAMQGDDGFENGKYISEKNPDVIVDFDKIRKGEFSKRFVEGYFGISGKKSDLEPMTVDKSGNLISKNGRQFSNRDEGKTAATSDSLGADLIENRVFGDRLLDAQDLIETVREVGGNVDSRGYITVYHRTTADKADQIRSSGKMVAKEDGLFFSVNPDGQDNQGYGDTVLAFRIPAEKLVLDDIFADDASVRLPLGSKRSMDVSKFLEVNSVEGAQFSERDYSDVSDLDLLLNAADEISEGGGDEYWASLLSEEPGLANETAEIKRLGKQLKKTAAELAEAQRNLTLSDRKLKTRGIASLAATIMQDQKAGDINKKDVKNRITAVLTEAYQKALDQLDAGADVGTAWETVYNEGVVKAADILMSDATYAEKHGYGWVKTSLGKYLGEGGREYVEADIAARVAQDFETNRYRPGQKGTIADRLVAQAENRLNKKLTAAKTENAALKAENAKLSEDKAFFEAQAKSAKETAGDLYQQLLDKREELKNNKKLSADERKAMLKKLDNMTRQMQAKRKEAQVWKEKAQGETKKVNQAIREKEAAVSKLEKQLQRERDILAGKLKPPAIQKMLAAAREREGKRIAEQKDEHFAKYKEKQSAAQLRSRIKNLSDEMKRKMTKPTDGSYVPASLYGAMTRVADLLDNALAPKAGTKAEAKYRAMMDAIHALQSEYGKVAEMDDYTYKSEFDTEIMDEIKELEEVLAKDQSWIMRETGDNRSLREYSLGDLTRIYEILRTINEATTSASHFLGRANFQSVWDAMGQIAEQQGDMTSLNRLGWYSKKKRMRMLDSLNVMRATEMMSNWDRNAALYRIMQQVENGVDVSNAWMMEYNKAMQALKTGKNEKAYRDALTKKLDFNVTDEEGLPVQMTKMQALQLLMTAEREAHNDKLVHLQRGGATIRDALAIQDGKKDVKTQNIKVTPELINRIQQSLTEWDKAYMKAVRDYFGREGKATNRVLYKLKHRVLQTEDYYVPYAVDKNYLDTNLDETQAMNMWVKTPGSTNALANKASQPVIIDGMDTVMAKHVKDIADYIGLAIPIRDFAKVYNGRLKQGEGENPLPVKQTIAKNFGDKGQHLLTQSIIDVQGGSRGASWSTAIAEHLNALQSAFVKSALLINPSVTIKQAASYAAAGSILSHAALDRANHPISVKTDESNAFDPATGLIGHIFFAPNGATAMRIYNEIDKHTSLHYMRRQGMSQAEIANEANRSGKFKRAMNSVGASMEQTAAGHIARKVGASLNPVSWIQRMDVATTATLWLACKEQARMDGMKVGTDEYWQHVTELYERVIRETQPMYDSLHRNAGQKSRENSLMQYLFPFRTVPIQNHGQIAASYETLQTALKSKDEARIKEAKKFFAKTMWAQTESAIIFSLMTFLAAALKRKTRKYRDEDEEISLESILQGISSDAAGTMFANLFPLFGSAIWDSAGNIYDSVKTGKKVWSYDAYSVGVVDLMNEFAKAGESLVTDAANMIAGKDVGWDKLSGDIAGMLEKSLKCLGIPASTIKTYTDGFIGNLEDIKEGRVPALNDASWDRSNALNASRYYKAWMAGDEEKLDSVIDDLVKSTGGDEDKLRDAVNTVFKNAYEAGEISLDDYTDFIQSSGLFSDEQEKNKIRDLAKNAFTAEMLTEDEAIDYLTGSGYYDEDEAWKKVMEWKAKAEHEDEEEYSYSPYEDFFDGLDSGMTIRQAGADYLDHGYTEEQLAKAAKDHVKDLYAAGSIDEAEAIRMLKDAGMDSNDAWAKVQEWDYKATHAEDESYSKYDPLDEAIKANKEIASIVSDMIAHGADKTNVNKHIKETLVNAYVAGESTEMKLKNQLSRYLGIIGTDANEIVASANKKIRYNKLIAAYPNLDISESLANTWYDGTSKTKENGHESAKTAGMSIEAYMKAKAVLDEIKDENGNNTGEDEVIAALAKMNLTPRQKDALYYERYKGTTKISKTKSW